jgi:hypothetical protein
MFCAGGIPANSGYALDWCASIARELLTLIHDLEIQYGGFADIFIGKASTQGFTSLPEAARSRPPISGSTGP